MSKSASSSSSSGIGFFGLLGIVFIVLKLTGYIDWEWLWVLAPLWGGCVLIVGLIIIVIAAAFITSLIND